MTKMDPVLAAQLVNPADAELTAGSNTSVMWRCEKDDRHVWSATPNTRRRSPQCPVCLNKIVIVGVNDLATTHPDIADTLVDPDAGQQIHAGAHKKVQWSCDDPTHPTWEASVVSRTRLDSGCPYCSGRLPIPGLTDLATTHPDLVRELVDPSLATTVGAGSGKSLLWRCVVDDKHEPWKAPVRNRVGTARKTGTKCPDCQKHTRRSPTRAPTLGQISSPLLDEAVDRDRAATLTTGSGKVIMWRCTDPDCGFEYSMSVRHKMRGQGCPVCAGTMVVPGRNDLATTHPDLADQLVDQSLRTTVSRGSTLTTTWRCQHNHTWTTPVYARVAGTGCPECCPIGSSYGEQEVLAAVRVLDPSTTHRAQLPQTRGRGIEIDMLAGTLAIEFNGVFWHSEAAGRDKHAHARKLTAIHDAGLALVTIWEDDWTDQNRRAVIVRMLAHRLGRLDRLQPALEAAQIPGAFDDTFVEHLGARTLTPTAIPNTKAAAFFDVNHVQGAVTLTRSFALTDDQGRPRAVLGLRSPRHNARARRTPGLWEIQRYATQGSVPGGFSRLLAHAQRTLLAEDVDLSGWVTLSANESSDGALYAKSGFSVDAAVKPTYWYAGGALRGRRAPKEAFQLKRFRTDDGLVYEDGWTELEAAAENKMYRIWDAGKTRWVKSL